MSLFDPDLATKSPVQDPDFSSWMYYVPDTETIIWQYENSYKPHAYKPHVKFTDDKKQKQYRKYASRNISWKR